MGRVIQIAIAVVVVLCCLPAILNRRHLRGK